ncbi:unnamed protein product [Mycena citricolor]|uniref:YTH domain-containing protein n=1 Tax=Mycena citricolor TaxID=2018698 RepID=A0AAD2GXA1_9AGAR|nr:unnamed protein product [Mycena citricolor]
MEALKTPTRRPYHPAAPAKRSEWAMWVGNVPKDATEEELWDLFTGSRDHGVQSMILLSRTKCAFVNFVSEAHLAIGVERFDGKQLRPHSRRAPLVCRVRGREEDLQAGVGIQRGMGLHKEWVDAQRSHGDVDRLDSPISDASTSSSFLQTHFPQRFFVLKSHSRRELDRSVADGLWSTQSHNRGVLEQASRTAEETILFFSVNKSGEFYGYGRYSNSNPT